MIHTYTHRVTRADIDAYGHMNNKVINDHFERARVNFLDSSGLGYRSMIEQGLRFVVVENTTQYLRELFPGDVFDVWGRLRQHGRLEFFVDQIMLYDSHVAHKNTTRNQFTRKKTGCRESMLIRPPQEVLEHLAQQPVDVCRLL
jgi:YbgC/YbaW family acyl-CoA thioester hydrolase